MTTTTISAPTFSVAVLFVRITDGYKAIAAIRNVPEDEVDDCVAILRQHGTDTGYDIGAYATSTGRLEISNKSLVETDLVQLVAEVDRPNLDLVPDPYVHLAVEGR
jgi:hypothetical protein